MNKRRCDTDAFFYHDLRVLLYQREFRLTKIAHINITDGHVRHQAVNNSTYKMLFSVALLYLVGRMPFPLEDQNNCNLKNIEPYR